MTRRLLQAMAGARRGGAETFFVRLATALEHAGEAQRVLIRSDPDRSHQLRDAGVAVVELGFRNRFDLATRLAFGREIAEWRPSIVLTWMSRATQLCPPGDFVHVARLGGYYDLKHYRHCDYLIGNTWAIVAYAVEGGWPAERAHYVPNFVPDMHDAAPVPRAALGTPEGAPLALALGRLHPNKGFDLLLEALALTRDTYLWIAGDGPLRASLQQLTASLGLADRVRFLGWRDDVPALLASADFVVSSSRHEPLGNVVIEAWSAGRAVVATASDGPAALIEDEVSGLLAPLPGSPGGGVTALAGAIERAASDRVLRARLGINARQAYEAEFTEDIVVARYRRLFDELAA
jgi:glycosyltransferase involved in cell wall biosynthesis